MVPPDNSGFARRRGLLVTATLAALAATLCARAVTRALDCGRPSWGLQRVSVTGPEGAPDHATYWPLEAAVDTFPGSESMGVNNSAAADGVTISYVQGGGW